jgi:DNA-binding MarR family transcriptional regulator
MALDDKAPRSEAAAPSVRPPAEVDRTEDRAATARAAEEPLRFAEPAAESASVESDFLNLLQEVARQTNSYADAMARTLGVTHAQLLILARLERQSAVSQSELASIAAVTPPTISRLVLRLEELGLVERCPDPIDRRIWHLRLTPAASPILWQMRLLQPTLYRSVADGIDPRVIELMVRGLNRMKDNVNAARSAKARKGRRGVVDRPP